MMGNFPGAVIGAMDFVQACLSATLAGLGMFAFEGSAWILTVVPPHRKD